MVCRKTQLQDCPVSPPPLIPMARPHQQKQKHEENKIKRNYMTGCWTKSPHTPREKRGQIHSLRLHTVNITTRWEAAMTCHRLVCPPLSLWLLCNHHFCIAESSNTHHKINTRPSWKNPSPTLRRHFSSAQRILCAAYKSNIHLKRWHTFLYDEQRRRLKPTPNVFFSLFACDSSPELTIFSSASFIYMMCSENMMTIMCKMRRHVRAQL